MHIEPELVNAMKNAIEHLKKELQGLRSARANPALLDNVQVEIYGTKMRLRDVSNITVPESRQLLITPYDPNNSVAIAKSIESANLNLQPKIEHNAVRIIIPPMDEALRKDIVKQCKKKGEETKISIREIRRKYNDIVKNEKTSGNISEDEMKRFEKIIQDKTNEFCSESDKLCSNKEKEILEV